MQYAGKKLTKGLLMGLTAGCLTVALPQIAAAAEAEETPQDLGEVVVTAEKRPTQRMDTPENVAVITAKEIADNHYDTLTEAVEHVNGVSVTKLGGTDLVTVNGDQRVVVLIDGVRMNNDQGESTGRYSANLQMLPSLKNIARIEVIKGGASALYGSDAVGGVINIITKKQYENKTTVDLSTGSWKTHAYELTTQGNADGLNWFVGGKIDRRGYFKYKYNGDSYRMAHSDHDNDAFAVNLNQKIGERDMLRLAVQHKKVEADQYQCNGSTSAADTYNPRMEAIYNNESLTYSFKEGTAAPGRISYFNNYKTEKFGSRFKTRLQGIDYQNGWQLDPGNTVVAGAEWHQSKSSDKANGYNGRKITTEAVYLQDTWQFAPKWNFVPGVRMDHHSEFGTHWSPKAALNYRADKATQFYADWGRVFKAPTANDMYYTQDWGYGMGMFGSKNLDPERGWTATIGMNHRFDERTNVGMSFFKSRLHDAIRWNQVNYSWYAENMNLEDKRGLELKVNYKVSPVWRLEAEYSYTCTEVNKGDGRGKHLDAANRQPNGYRLGACYSEGAWKANLLGIAGTGLDDSVYTDSRYMRWDLNVSYTPVDALTIYAKALNLTNQHYPVYKSRYYPGEGRCFIVGMQYSF